MCLLLYIPWKGGALLYRRLCCLIIATSPPPGCSQGFHLVELVQGGKWKKHRAGCVVVNNVGEVWRSQGCNQNKTLVKNNQSFSVFCHADYIVIMSHTVMCTTLLPKLVPGAMLSVCIPPVYMDPSEQLWRSLYKCTFQSCLIPV